MNVEKKRYEHSNCFARGFGARYRNAFYYNLRKSEWLLPVPGKVVSKLWWTIGFNAHSNTLCQKLSNDQLFSLSYSLHLADISQLRRWTSLPNLHTRYIHWLFFNQVVDMYHTSVSPVFWPVMALQTARDQFSGRFPARVTRSWKYNIYNKFNNHLQHSPTAVSLPSAITGEGTKPPVYAYQERLSSASPHI